jgi:hypothetical protein
MFFYDSKLHRKRKIVKSSNSLVAWCYRDEEFAWLNLPYLRQNFKRAYTVSQAARLINTRPGVILNLIKSGEIKAPEYSYDFINGSYELQRRYFNQADMQDVRQSVWDALPKNRYGEPYRDTLTNAEALEYKMASGDDREFIQRDDGTIIKIYQA